MNIIPEPAGGWGAGTPAPPPPGRCLFCRRSFPPPVDHALLPPGRRFAFDPGQGRVWTICERCHRWTLHAPGGRQDVVERLERLVRDRGRLVARTAHVAWVEAGRLELLRVGPADLLERAWWRYGGEFRRRRGEMEGALAKASALTFGAVAAVGAGLGLAVTPRPVRLGELEVEEVHRWRRFGWIAWTGRLPCPHCGSVRRALSFEVAWWTYPVRGEDGEVALGIPCSRCDHWTADEAPRLGGAHGAAVLRRVLAWQNVGGAPESTLRQAMSSLDRAGSAEAFTAGIEAAGEGGTTLWRLGSARSVALEMAVTEGLEDRILRGRLRLLEFVWRQEEALAAIQDRI